eukprot:403340214
MNHSTQSQLSNQQQCGSSNSLQRVPNQNHLTGQDSISSRDSATFSDLNKTPKNSQTCKLLLVHDFLMENNSDEAVDLNTIYRYNYDFTKTNDENVDLLISHILKLKYYFCRTSVKALKEHFYEFKLEVCRISSQKLQRILSEQTLKESDQSQTPSASTMMPLEESLKWIEVGKEYLSALKLTSNANHLFLFRLIANKECWCCQMDHSLRISFTQKILGQNNQRRSTEDQSCHSQETIADQYQERSASSIFSEPDSLKLEQKDNINSQSLSLNRLNEEVKTSSFQITSITDSLQGRISEVEQSPFSQLPPTPQFGTSDSEYYQQTLINPTLSVRTLIPPSIVNIESDLKEFCKREDKSSVSSQSSHQHTKNQSLSGQVPYISRDQYPKQNSNSMIQLLKVQNHLSQKNGQNDLKQSSIPQRPVEVLQSSSSSDSESEDEQDPSVEFQRLSINLVERDQYSSSHQTDRLTQNSLDKLPPQNIDVKMMQQVNFQPRVEHQESHLNFQPQMIAPSSLQNTIQSHHSTFNITQFQRENDLNNQFYQQIAFTPQQNTNQNSYDPRIQNHTSPYHQSQSNHQIPLPSHSTHVSPYTQSGLQTAQTTGFTSPQYQSIERLHQRGAKPKTQRKRDFIYEISSSAKYKFNLECEVNFIKQIRDKKGSHKSFQDLQNIVKILNQQRHDEIGVNSADGQNKTHMNLDWPLEVKETPMYYVLKCKFCCNNLKKNGFMIWFNKDGEFARVIKMTHISLTNSKH